MKKMNEHILEIIRNCKTIAVVGLSDKPHRPSYRVAKKMLAAGYRVIPVNPEIAETLGFRSYPDLTTVPEKVDLVDVFRRPEHAVEIAEQTIGIGARALWLQLGVINEKAAQMALDAGLDVVMDRCWAIEFDKLKL